MAEPKLGPDTIWAEESRGNDRVLPPGDTIWDRESRGNDKLPDAEPELDILVIDPEETGCFPPWTLPEQADEELPELDLEPVVLGPGLELDFPPVFIPEGDILL